MAVNECIRIVSRQDLPALAEVIDGTGLFPSELLDGMLAPHLDGGASDELWLTFDDGAARAVIYASPERMTQGTWNMLLLAVHPARQGAGMGGALVAALEAILVARGARVLLVETSGLPAFERTRAFYRGRGYEEEARIREFYAPGEDKIVFRKSLSP